jgi:hypothetical protein
VGPQDHWLPPDNYQEHPVATIAHRTSPTNMGLALLANLSAYDFGYIPAGDLVVRTGNALRTMETLERYRGHFYNWYDTQTCKPLAPVFISTVDSGNLAGHLLTLAPGLSALPDDRILSARVFAGLSDAFAILLDSAGGAARARLAPLEKELESTRDGLPFTTLEAARLALGRIGSAAADLAGNPAVAAESEAMWWAQALARQCQSALEDLTFLAPWIALPAAPPGLSDWRGEAEIPTLRELAGLDVEFLATSARPHETAEQRDWLSECHRLLAQGGGRAPRGSQPSRHWPCSQASSRVGTTSTTRPAIC